jgi:Flp pilus assembly protein TadG
VNRAIRGQAMVEFALVIAFLFLASVGSFYLINQSANNSINRTQNGLQSAVLAHPTNPSQN